MKTPTIQQQQQLEKKTVPQHTKLSEIVLKEHFELWKWPWVRNVNTKHSNEKEDMKQDLTTEERLLKKWKLCQISRQNYDTPKEG